MEKLCILPFFGKNKGGRIKWTQSFSDFILSAFSFLLISHSEKGPRLLPPLSFYSTVSITILVGKESVCMCALGSRHAAGGLSSPWSAWKLSSGARSDKVRRRIFAWVVVQKVTWNSFPQAPLSVPPSFSYGLFHFMGLNQWTPRPGQEVEELLSYPSQGSLSVSSQSTCPNTINRFLCRVRLKSVY